MDKKPKRPQMVRISVRVPVWMKDAIDEAERQSQCDVLGDPAGQVLRHVIYAGMMEIHPEIVGDAMVRHGVLA